MSVAERNLISQLLSNLTLMQKKYSRFSFCIPPLVQPEAVCLARARRQKG
jgi:hypothetical protein